MDEDHGGLGYKMYRNMLSDLSVVDQNHLFGIKGFLLQDESYGEFVHKLYEGIDRERYPIDEETLSYLVDMTMLIIIRAVTLYYKECGGPGKTSGSDKEGNAYIGIRCLPEHRKLT